VGYRFEIGEFSFGDRFRSGWPLKKLNKRKLQGKFNLLIVDGPFDEIAEFMWWVPCQQRVYVPNSLNETNFSQMAIAIKMTSFESN